MKGGGVAQAVSRVGSSTGSGPLTAHVTLGTVERRGDGARVGRYVTRGS